ncbi:hypothetical protein DRW03_18000 [Corallococcus sp. H22C18031201]|nr:hypothetical protein DRW03_18000 [Corallococcus sp. H22C18031201]
MDRGIAALLICGLMGVPRLAQATEALDRQLREAVRLYEDLEYEQALGLLKRAHQSSRGASDDTAVFLLEGIVCADLGRWEAARSAFRSALLQQPEARLPLKISPKVEREFEAERVKARQELARRTAATPASKTVATSKPLSVDVEKPQVGSVALVAEDPLRAAAPAESAPVASSAPSEVLTLRGDTTRSGAASGRRVSTVTWSLLGAGVVAGGVGSVFGVSSRGHVADARKAQFQDELILHHTQAESTARTANILFGVAGAVAVGAVVTWLLTPSESVASVEVAR